MANYTLANLVKAQLKMAGEFANNDMRYRIPAVFQLFIRNTQNFFPDYKSLKSAEKRVLEANFLKKNFRATSTAGISHNHTGTGSDSGILSLNWINHSVTFSMTLKQSDGNLYSLQEMLTNEIRNSVISFANSLDDASVNYLFANKSGVNPAAVKGTFNSVKGTYEITESTFGTQAMTITKAVMDINKYQGQQFAIVCDSISWTTFLHQAAQGAQNATNLSFQFMNTLFVHAPQLTALASALDSTYTKGYWVAVPENHIAVLDWIERQNVQGIETSVSMYGSLRNPVDGLLYGVHSYEERADGTAVNGSKQDVLTQTQISIYLSFNHAPSSTANETPIYAFALK